MTELERFVEKHQDKILITKQVNLFPHVKGDQVTVYGISNDLGKTGGNPKTKVTLVGVFCDGETVRDYSNELRYCKNKEQVAA